MEKQNLACDTQGGSSPLDPQTRLFGMARQSLPLSPPPINSPLSGSPSNSPLSSSPSNSPSNSPSGSLSDSLAHQRLHLPSTQTYSCRHCCCALVGVVGIYVHPLLSSFCFYPHLLLLSTSVSVQTSYIHLHLQSTPAPAVIYGFLQTPNGRAPTCQNLPGVGLGLEPPLS